MILLLFLEILLLPTDLLPINIFTASPVRRPLLQTYLQPLNVAITAFRDTSTIDLLTFEHHRTSTHVGNTDTTDLLSADQ